VAMRLWAACEGKSLKLACSSITWLLIKCQWLALILWKEETSYFVFAIIYSHVLNGNYVIRDFAKDLNKKIKPINAHSRAVMHSFFFNSSKSELEVGS
jgi:hypothetical protein